MVRVLHILGSMNQGGLENLIMNLLRNIDTKTIKFDFLVQDLEEAAYDKEIISFGSTIYRTGIRRDSLFKYRKYLKKFFKSNNYDVVHIHTTSLSNMEPAIFARKYSSSIIIVHSHNTVTPKGIQHRIESYINKNRINKYCDYKFACGIDAGLACFGVDNKDEIIIFNNAVDAKMFDYNELTRDSYKKNLQLEGKKIIGNVARFTSQKNHSLLVDIFFELHSIDNSYHLLLVGNGELEDNIYDKVKGYKLLDSVTFLGNRNDVSSLMQLMDIFIMPSIYEGLPLVLIEAQSADLKIIASATITEEVNILGNIDFIDLNASIDKWVNAIIKYEIPQNRRTRLEDIKQNKYDIAYNVDWITNFYIENKLKG